jgi:hypothetical protein
MTVRLLIWALLAVLAVAAALAVATFVANLAESLHGAGL